MTLENLFIMIVTQAIKSEPGLPLWFRYVWTQTMFDSVEERLDLMVNEGYFSKHEATPFKISSIECGLVDSYFKLGPKGTEIWEQIETLERL